MPSANSASSSAVARRSILGVRVDDCTFADLAAAVEAAIGSGQPGQIVTINPEMLMAARRDAALRDCIEHALLVAPDGVGLILAGRLFGRPLRQRVTGSDGLPFLCARAAERGWRPFLLGGAPGVAEEAARRLSGRITGLDLAGTYSGSPDPGDEDVIAAIVRAAKPDILFVAYGVPTEETWISRNLARLDVPVAIGIGGALDFAAGKVPRAPVWLQRLGLEWLYRLYLQPWRWRRMLVLPAFLALVVAEAVRARLPWCRRLSRG